MKCEYWTAELQFGHLKRSLDHEKWYWTSRIWLGLLLNGMDGLHAIPMVDSRPVSGQLAAHNNMLV